MKDQSSEIQFSEAKRTMDRDSLFLRALLRFPNDKVELEGRIRNLSAGGLMAEGRSGLACGERIEVNLHGIGWISGQITWVSDSRFGIAFDQLIETKDARRSVGVSQFEIRYDLQKLNQKTVLGTLRHA